MSKSFIFCGLGGQGLMFMTRLIAEIALRNNYSISGIETHGMSQRGGSIVSHLKIDSPNSGLIQAGFADYLIALTSTEALRQMHYLKENGTAFINNSDGYQFQNKNIRHYNLNNLCIEHKLYNKVNILMTGILLASQPFIFKEEHVWESLSGKPNLEPNRRAVELGMELGAYHELL